MAGKARNSLNHQFAVLFANDAFYTAFAARDMTALQSVWSRRDAVSCVHPGWGPLAGREAVMESWEGILTGRHPPEITCHDARAFVLGDAAYVICFERIGDTTLVATNVFVREDGAWRMVHHQAAVCPPLETGQPGAETSPAERLQ
jgi:ketosteroid isomerase-like protein